MVLETIKKTLQRKGFLLSLGLLLLNTQGMAIAEDANSAAAKPVRAEASENRDKALAQAKANVLSSGPGASKYAKKPAAALAQVKSQRPATAASALIPDSAEDGLKVKEDYLIQPSDRIKIKVYPEDEYIRGADMQVSSDGNITLPLVGKVEVAGKTLIAAEKEIAAIIDKDYIVNPEVAIEILEYGTKTKSLVIVLGQVRKPGSYDFPPDKASMTLLEIISMAGGFSEVANVKKIKIIRKENGEKKVINANAEAIISGDSQDVELQSGDVINVAESLF